MERAIARAETVEGAGRSDLYWHFARTLQELGELDPAMVAVERAIALCRVEHPDARLRLAGYRLDGRLTQRSPTRSTPRR